MTTKTAKARKQNEFVFVIEGKEQTLVNAKYTELIDRLLPPQERATGLWMADADKVTVTEVLDELRTLPFLTKKRVVVLRNAAKFLSESDEKKDEKQDEQKKQKGHREPSNRELLEKYFDNPCPTGVLVMTVSSWPGTTKLAKKLPKIGTLLKVVTPKDAELRRLLTDYARESHAKRLDYGTADLLVETAGDDITRLKTEIDKLAAYADDAKAITAEDVEALVGHNRLFDAFKVIDACLQRNAVEAVQRLRIMFEANKDADYTTVGAFAYHFRKMFTAKKMLQDGYSEYEVAGKARIFYNKQAHFSQLKRLTLKQIGDQLKQLAETDYAIKRGQAQPRIALEQLVLKMAGL
ncbi:MAG: DNA polymerase III subunit delta [Sedimentisphaerales bacterium]|nr:DNA polymerase III subunit delta [Sedimentisphaerales bacterium]